MPRTFAFEAQARVFECVVMKCDSALVSILQIAANPTLHFIAEVEPPVFVEPAKGIQGVCYQIRVAYICSSGTSPESRSAADRSRRNPRPKAMAETIPS